MKLTAIASLAVTALLATSAAAQPSADPPEPSSPTTARLLSVGGTAVGWGLFLGGFAADDGRLFFAGEVAASIGPAAGHLYAGETGHALLFSGLRAGAFAVADLGVVTVVGCALDDHPTNDCGNSGTALLLGGLGAIAGLTVYDWYDAGRAAERSTADRPHISFVPMVRPGVAGLGIAGSF